MQWLALEDVQYVSDTELFAVVPAGLGKNLDVEVTCGNGLPTLSPGVLSYDPPVVTTVYNLDTSVRSGALGSTAGGATVVIEG